MIAAEDGVKAAVEVVERYLGATSGR
jgi:hypothetical protein